MMLFIFLARFSSSLSSFFMMILLNTFLIFVMSRSVNVNYSFSNLLLHPLLLFSFAPMKKPFFPHLQEHNVLSRFHIKHLLHKSMTRMTLIISHLPLPGLSLRGFIDMTWYSSLSRRAIHMSCFIYLFLLRYIWFLCNTFKIDYCFTSIVNFTDQGIMFIGLV
jgi:hypothetical protein